MACSKDWFYIPVENRNEIIAKSDASLHIGKPKFVSGTSSAAQTQYHSTNVSDLSHGAGYRKPSKHHSEQYEFCGMPVDERRYGFYPYFNTEKKEWKVKRKMVKHTPADTCPERFTPKVKKSTGVYVTRIYKACVSRDPRILLDRVRDYLLAPLPKGCEAERIGALAIIGNARLAVGSTYSKVVRDLRDGAKQRAFENNCSYVQVLVKSGEEHDLYKYVDRVRSNTPKFEFGSSLWVPDEVLNNAEDVVLQHKADDYVYTKWVPKTKWFADEVEAIRLRIEDSRKRMAPAQLDPLRPTSDVLSQWHKDTKALQKRTKEYIKECPPHRSALVWDLMMRSQQLNNVMWPENRRIAKKPEEALCIGTTNIPTTLLGTLGSTQGFVRDLNPTVVSMAERMGTRYNVVDGIWQSTAQPVSELQWAGWDAFLFAKYGITERMTLREAENLQKLTQWMTSRVVGWRVPVVSLRKSAWERYGKGAWEEAGEVYIPHLGSTVSFVDYSIKFEESCVCRFCRNAERYCTEHFTTTKALSKHEREQHPEQFQRCDGYTAAISGEGDAPSAPCLCDGGLLLKVQHQEHGNVLFLRALWDNRYAWVLHQGDAKRVNVSDLTVDGHSFIPPVLKNYARVEEESTQRVFDGELDYFLRTIYQQGLTYEKAMQVFRKNREELLSNAVYLFCDTISGRNKSERRISIEKKETKFGSNWYLKVNTSGSSVALYLGQLKYRGDKPTIEEVRRHCIAKETPPDGVTEQEYTKEWLKWAVMAQICYEAGGTWAEDDECSPGVFPYIVNYDNAIGDNTGDDEADIVCNALNSESTLQQEIESEVNAELEPETKEEEEHYEIRCTEV